ncbi:MAG: anaerobic ribonucleoside-triphosphate reductase activating protein [Planctomycetota bacterium]
MPVVRGFIANSLNEWKGMIAAVIFLPGCNWRCPYCHGWRFITEPESMPEFSWEEVDASLRKNRGWVEGVVVTGGEATLHPGLPELLRRLRKRHLKVKLHSNGSRPEVLRACLEEGLVDCLALDYKTPMEDAALRKATGGIAGQKDLVRESMGLGREYSVPLELHTTLCPAVLSFDQVREMAQEVATHAPKASWVLQQYHPEEVLDRAAAGEGSYPAMEIRALVEELRPRVSAIEVRGI